MASQNHVELLRRGVEEWNTWRWKNPDILPDLSGFNFAEPVNGKVQDYFNIDLRGVDVRNASFSGLDLREIDLRRANLSGARLGNAMLEQANLCQANLEGAHLVGATLDRADLIEANLSRANLSDVSAYRAMFQKAVIADAFLQRASLHRADLFAADLRGADLRSASLADADLTRANFANADLRDASLQNCRLVETDLQGANMDGCAVFGASVWAVKLDNTVQTNLVITGPEEPAITIDSLEVAQFLYLILNNAKIRSVIDALTTKVVLILGRFTSERKGVLEALRDTLRVRNYTPVLFDFEKPTSRSVTETVRILSSLSRFVIADLTNAQSVPQELMAIVPDLPSVPVQPLLLATEREYGMFEHFIRFPWVLPIYHYKDEAALLDGLVSNVIAPAEAKAYELVKPRVAMS